MGGQVVNLQIELVIKRSWVQFLLHPIFFSQDGSILKFERTLEQKEWKSNLSYSWMSEVLGQKNLTKGICAEEKSTGDKTLIEIS